MSLKFNSNIIVALGLFSMSIILSIFSFPLLPFFHSFKNDEVQTLVKTDIRRLQNTPNYSNFFQSVFFIEKFSVNRKSKDQQNLINTIESNIETAKSGLYILQIELYLIKPTDLIDEKTDHSLWIVQYSFFDKTTRNKLFEVSRSYIDKKK